jgi:hypothetical protein
MSRFAVALFLVVGACSGDDDGTTEPIGPETCDNGVDDNGNGLVDCEDSTFCGGLQCITTGDDDDDTTTELPEVEIDFSGTSVEFTFTPQSGTCSQPIRTFTVVNRNEDLEAVVDANCDLINGGTAGIGFDVDGASPRQYVVDGAARAGHVDGARDVLRVPRHQRRVHHRVPHQGGPRGHLRPGGVRRERDAAVAGSPSARRPVSSERAWPPT